MHLVRRLAGPRGGALSLLIASGGALWAQPAAIAPTFTTHPTSRVVKTDASVTFTVTASGTPSPNFLWRKNGAATGVIGPTLTISNLTPSDAGLYTAVATNSAGSVTSNPATLVVVRSPTSNGVSAGSSLSFSVLASGPSVPTFQWRKDGQPVNGATGSTLVLVHVQPGQDQSNYDALITTPAGAVDSEDATLTVFNGPIEDNGTDVTPGRSVSFSVQPVTGATFQWRKGNASITGATNATYTIASVTPPDAGTYSVVITTAATSVTSAGTTLRVNTPVGYPAITTQPTSRTANIGAATSFTIAASGTPTPALQWFKNGALINGATGATLNFASVQAADAGTYVALATNSVGAIASTAATLTVSTPDPGRLINLSILTSITAADPMFTVGVSLGGAGTSGPKAVLVRAAGPTLALPPLNVPGSLPDPKMDVFSAQTVIATNDNWDGAPALLAVFTQVGAFPYESTTSRDAAVYNAAMQPGGYTVQVSGIGGATGQVIAEIYDATPANQVTATTPRLTNVSVLKRIDAGGLLTAGFVIGGSTSKTVLVRAVGPRLADAPFNIPGVMSDPRLELFRGQTSIDANDNWGGGAALTGAFASVGAFSLNGNSRDAALLVTLSPASYTAQVSGVGGAAGTVIVEVYEIP